MTDFEPKTEYVAPIGNDNTIQGGTERANAMNASDDVIDNTAYGFIPYPMDLGEPVKLDSDGIYQPDPKPTDGKRYVRTGGVWVEDTSPLSKQEQLAQKQAEQVQAERKFILESAKARKASASGAELTAINELEQSHTEIETLEREIVTEQSGESGQVE